MKKYYVNVFTIISALFLLLAPTNINAQRNFKFPDGIHKDKISFELVNNLVVIPVEVNNVKLSFILDTGVDATFLFGFAKDTLQLATTSKMNIRGFGEDEAITALRSEGNVVRIGDAVDDNHDLLVIFDESLNLSVRMGVPIHGIIGYNFFKNFVVKTDYNAEKLTFYNPDTYQKKKCKGCETFNLKFFKKKPYLSSLTIDEDSKEKLLLIDSGSSDAIWLFDETGIIEENGTNYYEDYLGLGLSGNIYGKRTKVKSVSFGKFSLDNVNVAIPNKIAIDKNAYLNGRDGSLGADILKRFTVIMDYENKTMTLRKNAKYKDPFYYNMSGLTLEHKGITVIKERVTSFLESSVYFKGGSAVRNTSRPIPTDNSYRFSLTPSYIVVDVREGSPAALADIRKDDEVLRVNGRLAYTYKLYELTELFTSKENKTVFIEVKRGANIYKKKFKLSELFLSL